MKSFKIVPFFVGKKTNFYSIQFEGESSSEGEKFFKTFQTEYPNDIQLIASNIKRVAELRGAFPEEFRHEGKAAFALPLGTSKLRLYVYRVSTKTVIIGNGGYKDPKIRTFNKVKVLANCVKVIENLDKIIREKIEESPYIDIDKFIKNFSYTEDDGD